MTSKAVSPPRFSAEDKGKGTTWKQDLINAMESDIADAIIQDGEELEIAHLVSLWSDQMASDTVDNTLCHKEVTG